MGKTEKELADQISKNLKLPLRTGREFLRQLLDLVREDLEKTGRSELRGLGTFAVHNRPGRDTIHPVTKKTVHIPDRRAIRYRASKDVKELIQSFHPLPKPPKEPKQKPKPEPNPVPVPGSETPKPETPVAKAPKAKVHRRKKVKAKVHRPKKVSGRTVEPDSPDL